MSKGALFWLIVFGVSAALFFIVAVIVAFRGLVDLRDLLRSADRETRQRLTE